MPFDRLLNNVQSVINELENMVVESMMEVKEEIIDLNTSQLEVGKLSTGDTIEPEYVFDSYSKLKKSKGSKAPFGVPDLKLEGDFYSGFETSKLSEGLELSSKDSKAPELERKYSKDIYGLTDKNKSEAAEYIKPILINKILNGIIK